MTISFCKIVAFMIQFLQSIITTISFGAIVAYMIQLLFALFVDMFLCFYYYFVFVIVIIIIPVSD